MYDEAKRYAEALTVAFSKSENLSVGITRLFNCYGPRMSPGDGRAIPTFLSCALTDTPLPVLGDGSQTRSFCYVDDAAEAIASLGESNLALPVNVGNPEEVSIIELARRVIRLSTSMSELSFEEPRPGDPRQRCPLIDRASKYLEWSPRINLDEGLARTIAWAQQAISELQVSARTSIDEPYELFREGQRPDAEGQIPQTRVLEERR